MHNGFMLFCVLNAVKGMVIYMKIVECKAYLERYGETNIDNKFVEGKMTIVEKEDYFLLDVNVNCIFNPYVYQRCLSKDISASVTVEFDNIDKVLVQKITDPFWSRYEFLNKTTNFSAEGQAMLMKCKDKYACILPLISKEFKASITGSKLNNCVKINISKMSCGCNKINGTVAVITESSDPYDAVGKAYEKAVLRGLITTPLKKDKSYPTILEKLGWCTWNAFYHDVSEAGIIEKMEEFKAKKIPVKWVLIDDGWSEYSDLKLHSIYEDKTKFPSGLKGTIEILKKEYDIEAVGVWHAMTGYWQGVKDSMTNITAANGDTYVPCGYEFYSKWHKYLKEQGVDFLKIDAQGNIVEFLNGRDNALEKIFEIQSGLEQSVFENFDFMINCMGTNNINMFNRKNSVLVRNSDDFFPQKEDALKNHVLQNAYNAVFNDNLYYCDYDMWWSNHFEAEQNAALRAISGGPFYLSDAVGESNEKIINKFVNQNGEILRYDNAAKPTADCLFGIDNILKIYNTYGKNGIVAVFSFEIGGKVQIGANDFGGKGDYIVTEIFSGDSYRLNEKELIDVELNANSVKMFRFECN